MVLALEESKSLIGQDDGHEEMEARSSKLEVSFERLRATIKERD
jgi:hypothetical protein